MTDQIERDHVEFLTSGGLSKLKFPITCETIDSGGRWSLVSLLEWLGNGKWLAYDEDGEHLEVKASDLRNPTM